MIKRIFAFILLAGYSVFASDEFYTKPLITATMKTEVYVPIMDRDNQKKKVKNQEDAYNFVELFAKAYAAYLINSDQDLLRKTDDMFIELQSCSKYFKMKKFEVANKLKSLVKELPKIAFSSMSNYFNTGIDSAEAQQAERSLYESVRLQAREIFKTR